jgi:hypothetical protein
MTEIILAAITTLPPTLVALAALIKTTKLGKATEQVNRAVNHQPADAPTLISRIIAMESHLCQIDTTTQATAQKVNTLTYEQNRHLAWHQARSED